MNEAWEGRNEETKKTKNRGGHTTTSKAQHKQQATHSTTFKHKGQTSMKSIASVLALCVVASPSFIGTAMAKQVRSGKSHGPLPTVGGKCRNQGDFQNGNHCVKMTGDTLAEFTKVADISSYDDDWLTHSHDEWCVCLHDYLHMWGQGGGDTSQCSQAALSPH